MSRVVTFYSYKGGTGRSMALANVAWILASAGNRVLAIDWDLEAPGLHRYFHPFLRDKELSGQESQGCRFPLRFDPGFPLRTDPA
jgi:Mrp family chromosome partitioning ATPase